MCEDEPALGSLRQATRFNPDKAVVATVVSDSGTRVFVVCLEPAQVLPPHPAPAGLTLIVTQGEPVITVQGSSHSTTPGDVVVMATGALHTLRAGPHRAVVVGVLNRLPTAAKGVER